MRLILAAGAAGSVPVLGILLAALCLVGVVASGKTADAARVLFALLVFYALLIIYTGRELKEALEMLGAVLARVESEGDRESALLLRCISAVPFIRDIARADGSGGILAVFLSDFGGFSRRLLNLFGLAVTMYAALELSKPINGWFEKFPIKAVAIIAPFIVRYLICAVAMGAYLLLVSYVFSQIPTAVLTSAAYLVFLAMLAMLLTPVLNFVLMAAKVTKNSVLGKISAFVKENQMSGTLQAAFYGSALFIAAVAALQQAGLVDLLL